MPGASERYVLRDEIASGGMGVVYRALDSVLQREVAVKVLQKRFAPDSGVAARFLDEARIAGQLQHPGIPAVHDLGTLADGRPFLAMKLVKGETLDVLLKRRDNAAQGRGHFIAIFEQLCHAVGYAHAHDVIHRDLKPANIMVGAFGEVQVMDWGLAKVLSGDEREQPVPTRLEATTAPTVVHSQREGAGSQTQIGTVLGTLAFMPPEQALGAVGRVNSQSDVFGLGAILSVILTGRPPFQTGSEETVRIHAAQGKLDDCFARLDACGAEPELVSLCKRCLSPSQADRPADGGAVARAIAEFRAAADERARQAELDRVKAEAETREQRKRRRVQFALATAVILLLVVGGGFAWWSNAQSQAARDRKNRNAGAVAGLLDRCEEALRAGDTRRASEAMEAAQERMTEGGADEWSARLSTLTADLALIRDLDATDQFRWTLVDSKHPDWTAVTARYREALRRYGVDPDAESPEKTAARAAGSPLKHRIIAAWDWLLLVQNPAKVRAGLRVIDADPDRNAIRDAVVANDRERVRNLSVRALTHEQPPEFATFLGEYDASDLKLRRQLLTKALQRRPGNLELLMTLGSTYAVNQEEDAGEALRWYQAAVAAAPTNPAAQNNLGTVLMTRGDLAGAEGAFREAIRLDPRFVQAHHNLGAVLKEENERIGAEAAFREAIRLNPKFTLAYCGLGYVLGDKNEGAGAEAAYRKALELDSHSPHAHNGLGTVLQKKQDQAGAEAAFREAIRVEPKFAEAHVNLGSLLLAKGNLAGAEAAFREAIRVRPKFVEAHVNLGSLLLAKGNLAGAEAAYRRAISLEPRLAYAHQGLGCVLRDKNNLADAEAAFREAVRLAPEFAPAYSGLGDVLYRRLDLAGSKEAYRKAISLDPDLAYAHISLGRVLQDEDDLRDAEAAYRAAIRLSPESAVAHSSLGGLLVRKGNLDGAIAEFKAILRIDPKDSFALTGLHRAEQMKQLLPRLTEVLENKSQPATPTEACLFATLCGQPCQKRYAAAVRLFEGAFSSDPNLAADFKAGHRYDAACYATQASDGKGLNPPAVAADRKALRQKALGWLRADLTLRQKQAASAEIAERNDAAAQMAHWLIDRDLSSARDPESLPKLPADERALWESLWNDVKATLANARQPAPTE
jgi:tetratricopeptide (TPR) repeat protein